MSLPLEVENDARRLASLGAQVDFHECGPCGGKCCRTPWTIFATPRDLERLAWHTGQRASEFADVKPLPDWERKAYGAANLLFSRVTAANGAVPQLRKRKDGTCVFLDARGLCGVHEAKPLMCRLFPFYYDVREDASAPAKGETRSPLGTARKDASGRTWFLLVDRGHAETCPITPARLADVEGAAGEALVALMQTFEADVARYCAEKESFVSAWNSASKQA